MSITPSAFPPDPQSEQPAQTTQRVGYPTEPQPPQPPQPPPTQAPPPYPPYPPYPQSGAQYPPQQGYYPPAPSAPLSSRSWFGPAMIAGLALLALANGVLFYQLGETNRLIEKQGLDTKERSGLIEKRLDAGEQRYEQRYGSLTGELRQTQSRLGATQRDLGRTREETEALGDQQKQAIAQIGTVGQQVSSLREESGAKLGALSGEVTTAKTDIATTRKDLEQTRLQLTSAVGDISKANVLIARNHDELGELRRRGERNYLEFDLTKEKQPRRIGDISLLLKKADPGKQKYTVELIVEDSRTEKKDRTANEPVQFYMGRARALYEIVVNRVSKDRIVGYMSTPK